MKKTRRPPPSVLRSSCAPTRQARRTPAHLEAVICQLRASLAARNDLGFIGPQAIGDALVLRCPPEEVPSIRTIAKALARHGLLAAARRLRRPAPPTGWHLPALGLGQAQVTHHSAPITALEGGMLRPSF